MPTVSTIPEIGQLAEVRGRRFVTVDVSRSLAASRQGHQHLVSLTSVEDGSLGEELQVVWEAEVGAKAFDRDRLPTPTAFDDPANLDAFLDAVRWGVVSNSDVRSFHAPFRSGVEIEDYQLDPLVRAVQMPRVNLLVADSVGLGKTIESGLIVQEMIFRNRVRTALILCPSSLQIQWRDEMRDKFGLEFRIVDSELLRELRRSRGVHANPWSHFPRLIASYDYLKRDRNLRLFQDLLPDDKQPTYPRAFDLLLCDEVHNVAPSGRNSAVSIRTEAVKTIAPHFEHRLFLSATPHNGYTESFASLLELLDNQRYQRGAEINVKQLHAVTMVRRLRSDIASRWDGTKRFPSRHILPLEVPYTEEEREVHAMLREYGELRAKNSVGLDQLYAVEFVLKLIKKRLFSSPNAFALTLRKHRESFDKAKPTARVSSRSGRGVLQRMADELDVDRSDDEGMQESFDEALDTASRQTAPLTDGEKQLLQRMISWADRATAAGDTKSRVLLDWLRERIKPGGKWSDDRVIVFTEYRDTQNWLHSLLAEAGLAEQGRLMRLFGGMKPDEREAIKAAFQASPDESDVRILLATDAASEGINLQNHCAKLIHVEIPWNPNRLEQRNGRIDRHGQKRDVEIFHFVAQGFDENNLGRSRDALEADLEFLFVAASKVNQIREDLGKVGPVIAQQVEEAMLGKRTRLDTSRAESDTEPIKKLLKAERDVQAQIGKLREQLEEIREELRLTPKNVCHVVEVGLALAGQPPLERTMVDGVGEAFLMPALRGAWERCIEGFNHPHTQRPRPIVFDHAAAQGRDDVVLVHLNHRLVQMCLRLLRAQIWSSGADAKMSRFTAKIVPDAHLGAPALIAHGRLLVTGKTHQKLHEEIIAAGGTIQEGRFQRMGVTQVESAIKHARSVLPPASMLQSIEKLWPTMEKPLQSALTHRLDERTANRTKFLEERAAKEKEIVTSALNDLRRTLESSIDEPEQLVLDLEGDETQRQRHFDAIRRRLEAIPNEIAQESAQIDQRYDSPTPRMFPVCVTFLVPESLARREGR